MSSSGEMANSNNSNNIGADFKRKRNFTEEEKNFLVELVQQHQQIITSKDNKSSMKLLKDKVWSEIHQQFNENNLRNFNNSTRTLDQVGYRQSTFQFHFRSKKGHLLMVSSFPVLLTVEEVLGKCFWLVRTAFKSELAN